MKTGKNKDVLDIQIETQNLALKLTKNKEIQKSLTLWVVFLFGCVFLVKHPTFRISIFQLPSGLLFFLILNV